MDYIGATPQANPLLGLLAERLKQAQEFAAKPFGYSNPPAEMIMNLLGVPAVQQTAERLAYGEPLTTGRGMTTQIRPEAVEAALTVAPVAGLLGKGAETAAMAAGRAGERYAEKVVPQIMERGGLPAQLLGDLSQGSIRPMDVWHGSPHKFDKFDASKIGTGEGNQSYSYGLYLAENPLVAKEYQQTVGNLGYSYKGEKIKDPITNEAAKLIYQNKGDISAAKKDAERYAYDNLLIPKIESMNPNDVTIGNLYKVDLPDEAIAKMLDWDKPLKDQTPEIKALAKQYGLTDSDHLGGDLVAAMGAKRPSGAEAMRQSGVTGVKYSDGASRGKESGTQNFVVFPGNENLLTIKEINDKPVRKKQNLLD